MISDEPDEDADALDDDAVIEQFLGDAPTRPDASVPAEIADWPRSLAHDPGLDLDRETQAWFESAYADWRRQMRVILRAWMMTHKTPGSELMTGRAR